MFASYNYPGASTFRIVEMANNKRVTRDAAKAWWSWTHEKNGPCAPGGGIKYGAGARTMLKYADGSRVLHGNEPTLFAPGHVPAAFPLQGWELFHGPGFVLHRVSP